ncbi:MAG: hypothetical protein ABT22_02130 [Thiobacillus sp. SCN 64-317]|nr:hypothetical protein [Thiobacillus sp.]ODV13919.1 MAG: hypothetical protein ABT22_02130 [Thiobacillus sp. SCN 64-317]
MTALPSTMTLQAQDAVNFSSSIQGHHMTAGPDGPVDIVLVALGAIIVLLVCVYTVKFLIWPRESNPDHIKRQILRDDF